MVYWTIEEAGVSFAFAPPCRAPESQDTVTLKSVQRGSHRKAVHQNATLSPCPPKEKYQIKKLVSVVPWIGFLVSAVSELGFDVDFPLTPTIWLAIAICAVMMATAHTAVSNGIHSLGKRETGTYLSGAVASLSDSANSISDRSPSLYQDDCSVTGGGHERMSSSGVIVTASDAILAVIFLNPAATRGPPGSDNQIDRPLDRPARHLCSAPLPSEFHFHDPSTPRNAFLNGPEQTPIRYAIEGVHA